jgi:DNA-binding CsgD family transcriptional regulator
LREAVRIFEQLGDETAVWYASLLALLCAEAGRHEEARAVTVQQERRLTHLEQSALPARSARCALGLTYAALEDREAGGRCEAALLPYADDFHWSPARRTLAALAALRGDKQTALAHLAAVEAQTRSEGLGPDLGLALLEHARLSPASERDPFLAEARELLGRLGMRQALERADALAEPGQRATAPAGLSAREVEVLRLVAQGKTNREIAATLVISERTVANHLSHIFDKIDVDNRASAAAFAFRNGLAEGSPS